MSLKLTPKKLFASDKDFLESWYPNFDYSLVKAFFYLSGWSTYDTSEMLLIFQGIDDSIQELRGNSNPFSKNNNEMNFSDISESAALKSIESFMKDIEEVENDDGCYGF